MVCHDATRSEAGMRFGAMHAAMPCAVLCQDLNGTKRFNFENTVNSTAGESPSARDRWRKRVISASLIAAKSAHLPGRLCTTASCRHPSVVS